MSKGQVLQQQIVCKCIPSSANHNNSNNGYVEFFFPRRLPCTCSAAAGKTHNNTSRQSGLLDRSQQPPEEAHNNDNDVMLEYILRPWQVRFLKESVSITNAKEFIKYYDHDKKKNNIKLLVKAMKKWCSKKLKGRLDFFITSEKCKFALRMWYKSCNVAQDNIDALFFNVPVQLHQQEHAKVHPCIASTEKKEIPLERQLINTHKKKKLQAITYRSSSESDEIEDHYCSTQIQRITRGHFVRIEKHRQCHASTIIQAYIRRWYAEKMYLKVMDERDHIVATIVIQAYFRRWIAECNYVQIMDNKFRFLSSVVIQAHIRRWIAQQHYQQRISYIGDVFTDASI